MNNTNTIADMTERPWWFVRLGLACTLAALVVVLTVLLARPELLDHSLALAGL